MSLLQGRVLFGSYGELEKIQNKKVLEGAAVGRSSLLHSL